MHLSKAVEGFLIFKAAIGLSEHTLSDYRINLDRMVAFLKDPLLGSVRPRDIEAFFKFLQSDYRYVPFGREGAKPQKISKKTARNAWGVASVFWKWAALEFCIDNPFSLPPIKASTKPIVPLSEDETQLLIEAARKHSSGHMGALRNLALLLTLLDTGVRISELCDANIHDLDLESGALRVTGKGSKTRVVYMGRAARRAVWKYLAARYPQGKPWADDPLFVLRDGYHRVDRHSVRNVFRRMGQAAGVKNVHPHRLRHTFSIEFLRNGGDVFTLQQLLGHTTLDMVKNYVKIAQVDLRNAHRKASPADNWRLK